MIAQESPAASPRKLRILCLHGYHGSGRVLRSQVAGLAAALEPLAELVFLDAPSLEAGDFGWWHATDSERDPADDDPGVSGPRRHYKRWERTRAAVVQAFAQRGPFDGILGFSQGAALAGLLVGLRAPDGRPSPDRPLVFGFAIVVSGFPANDPELARLYERTDAYALPSLHLVGRSDGVVAPGASRALAARFTSPVIVEHEHGHVVASDAHVVASVRAFLEAHSVAPAPARERERAPLDVPLWPGRDAPSMRVVFPKDARRATVAALVVLRGGAYATSQGSGGGAAEWAAEHGMVGIEVGYRTDVFPAPYVDAARAVRLVRSRAAEWGIDPARVGVLGFSAGGHLASLLSTQPALTVDPADALASVPARPDFVVLAYPLVSFVDGYSAGAFVGSAENFLGRARLDETSRRAFSNELHVGKDHPPVFLWTTADDALVPASHSRGFVEACRAAGVPVTFELYPHGPHGLGLALGRRDDVGGWTERLLAWLHAGGLVERR